RMLEEALADAAASATEPALVVARAGWHAGVAGIVAAKLVDRYHKPTAVIALDERGEGRGSLRTPAGFDLVAALTACKERLARYGGHAQAAGLTVAADRLPALRAAFSAQAARGAGPAPPVP